MNLVRSGDRERAAIALVGAGEFGQTLIAQAARSKHFRVAVVCDIDRGRTERALANAGYDDDTYVACTSRKQVLAAIAAERTAVIEDYRLLDDLPLMAVVEATGHPDTAADIAERALRSGFHLALATKEAEVVIGPVLAKRARSAGVVHTVVDGDQPSLLIGLIERAEMLGLPVVAAGKSTESDYVFDPGRRTISAWGRTVPVDAYDWTLDGSNLAASLARRRIDGLDTTTAPDLCEMTIVANHTDLVPDTCSLHGPVARTLEVPELFRPVEEGGLLGRSGVVDVFTCLRRPDEISFAGGVFVVAEAPNPATGLIFAAKGIPASRDGRYILLHNPVHLLGAEALASLHSATRLRRSTGGQNVRQRFDLVCRTTRPFVVGERLAPGARHTLTGTTAEVMPYHPPAPTAPIPFYLAAGGRICRPVTAGTILAYADVEVERNRALSRLRSEQDDCMNAERRA